MEQIQEYIPMIIEYGTKVIGVLVFVIVAWIVAGMIGNAVRRAGAKRNLDKAVTSFLAQLVKWGLLAAAIVAALGVFGIETTSFAAILASAGLAVGLAFQGSLSNFAAGIMLLTFRPFSVDHVISTGGVVGKVIEIGLFTVTLDTPDNRRIIVPNSTVFGATIENITFHETRRVDVGVGSDYGADLKQTRDVLEKVASSVDNGLSDPAPQVFLKELGGSSIDWVVRVWCETPKYWDVHQALTNDIKVALDEAAIGIPFPQMDVHVDGKLGD
jgi:small conductance mechanosensitive channel